MTVQPNTTIVSEGSQTHNDRHGKTQTTPTAVFCFSFLFLLLLVRLKTGGPSYCLWRACFKFFGALKTERIKVVIAVVTACTLFEWSCKTEIMRFYITFAKGTSHYVLIVTTVIHSLWCSTSLWKEVRPDAHGEVTRKTFVDSDPTVLVSRFEKRGEWKKELLTFYSALSGPPLEPA